MIKSIPNMNELVARSPAWLSPYLRLMRLDAPIGAWLLLLPCWWGIAIAAPGIPHPGLMIIFSLGAIVMRGAGCVINDIYDRDIDRLVARTRTRPLASGEIKLGQALIFLCLLLLIGFGVLLLLNHVTIIIGALSLLLVFTYPLMKRITWWPQLFLGLTFNWGVLMGAAAVDPALTMPPLLFYVAGVLWTLGYDTIYAHQDIADDIGAGVKSTALLFGKRSRLYVSLFYMSSLSVMAAAGWTAHLHEFYYYGLIGAMIYAAMQLILWRPDDAENCLRRFKSNRDFGLIIFIAIVAGQIL